MHASVSRARRLVPLPLPAGARAAAAVSLPQMALDGPGTEANVVGFLDLRVKPIVDGFDGAGAGKMDVKAGLETRTMKTGL